MEEKVITASSVKSIIEEAFIKSASNGKTKDLICLCSQDIYDFYILYLSSINPNISKPVNFIGHDLVVVLPVKKDFVAFEASSNIFLNKEN